MSDVLLQARGLVDVAISVFDDPDARKALRAASARLNEPLRIAVAGMVKAGKSTLLNAIIGDEIAPTDAGECTRVVTWYRYGHTSRITVHPKYGHSYELPVRRIAGRLDIDLGSTKADDVERLVVEWPSEGLRTMTLIDTPGIASLSGDVSARSTDFLTPDDSPSEADAIIYLMRHLHESDLGFLDAFHDQAVGGSSTVNAMAVLSRADEVGSGRIDAMLSAQDIAARYRRDGALRSLALGVVPVAGLLAQSARTLRQSEFEALVELSKLDRNARERMLISVDRFVRPMPEIASSPQVRADLLDRFGIFGIRVASSLLRGEASESATVLAHALRGQSGLDELLHSISDLFRARADLLRARGTLQTIERLLCDRRDADGAARVATALERLEVNAHGLRELRLISIARTTGLGLGTNLADQAERLLGARGDSVRERLGLPSDASDDEARARARELAREWRARESDPRLERSASAACSIIARSAEAQLDRLGRSRTRLTPRLSLGAEPVAGTRQE